MDDIRRAPAFSRPFLPLILALALPASPFAQVIQTPFVSAPLGTPLAGLTGSAAPGSLPGTTLPQPILSSPSLALPAVSLPSLPESPAVRPTAAASPQAAAPSIRGGAAPARNTTAFDQELPVVSRWKRESRDLGAGSSGRQAELSEFFDGGGSVGSLIDTLVNDRFEPQVYEDAHIQDARYAALLEDSWHLMSSEPQSLSSPRERLRLAARNALLERIRRGDPDTYSHMVRVGLLSGMLALELGLPRDYAARLSWAAAFHDLGKMRADVLQTVKKPGKLSAEERQVMEAHASIGARKLYPRAHLPEGLRELAISVALNHHERYDGKGYPRKLRGTDIPLEARITAVADIFDALMEHRPYRQGMTWEKAVSIMSMDADLRFSPEVWNAFLGLTLRMLSPTGKPGRS